MELPRKIQVTGRNTYIVSLPHEWISKRGISKGHQIFMSESQDGSLVLSQKKTEKELKTIGLDVSSLSRENAMMNIVSAYVGGAGKIILRGKGGSTLAEEARRVLSGIEITDEEGDSITLRAMDFEEVNIDGIMKRAFNVTQSMFRLAISGFRDGSDMSAEMCRKEDEADRLFLLMLRTLCIGDYRAGDAMFRVISAKGMEKIADHLEEIGAHMADISPDEGIASLLGKALQAYSESFNAFSKNELDPSGFRKAMAEFRAELERFDNQVKKEKKTQRMLALRSLREKCIKVVRYSEDIMENTADMAFAKMDGMDEHGSGE